MSNLQRNELSPLSVEFNRAFAKAFAAKDSDNPANKQATHVIKINPDGSVSEEILPLRYFPPQKGGG